MTGCDIFCGRYEKSLATAAYSNSKAFFRKSIHIRTDDVNLDTKIALENKTVKVLKRRPHQGYGG